MSLYQENGLKLSFNQKKRFLVRESSKNLDTCMICFGNIHVLMMPWIFVGCDGEFSYTEPHKQGPGTERGEA